MILSEKFQMDRVKRIWYLSPMRAVKVQASLRIRAVSPEPSLLAHTSSESRGTFRQKARSLAPLNGWACAVKMRHDGMLEDTNSLDAAQMSFDKKFNAAMQHPTLFFFLSPYRTRGPWATTLTWMYSYKGYIQPKYCKCCMQEPEAHGPQRSPACTAMKAIFSQNTVNVACKNQRPMGHNAHLHVQLWRLYSAKIL